MSDGYLINEPTARRIDTALRRDGKNRDAAGTGDPAAQAETCWAKLTNKIDQGAGNPDLWEWVEVYPKPDGTWATLPEGRKGDNSADDPYKLLAAELTKGTGAANLVALLRRMNVKETDGSFRTRWGIVRSTALPPPRSQFMVLTLMDGAGTIDWDYTKGH
jgi:hypothetical protein